MIRDPDGLLELSAEQNEAGVIWRRPSEVWASAKIFSSDLRPEDISQRVVADCSLCASIVVCLLHNRSHNSQVWLTFGHTFPRLHLTAIFIFFSRLRCPPFIPVGWMEGHSYLRRAHMSSKSFSTEHIDE